MIDILINYSAEIGSTRIMVAESFQYKRTTTNPIFDDSTAVNIFKYCGMSADEAAQWNNMIAGVFYVDRQRFSEYTPIKPTQFLSGAESRTRTGDLLITNQLLYQLSYPG
jgi:hypothetical protein